MITPSGEATLLFMEKISPGIRALDKREYLVIIRDDFLYICIKTYLVTPSSPVTLISGIRVSPILGNLYCSGKEIESHRSFSPLLKCMEWKKWRCKYMPQNV